MRSTIPWAALVVVAIFAFMQLDAAQRARRELAKARDADSATNGAAPASSREQELDAALSKEQAAHRDARKRISVLEAEVASERERADSNEALRATERARADALEQQKEQSPGKSEPVKQWLEDVASGNAARIEYARARASGATAEQIAALGALVAELEPARLSIAAHLVGALPDGAPKRSVIADLVLRLPDVGVSKALTRLGSGLLSLEVFLRVIDAGSNRLRDNYVRRVAQKEWTAGQREQIAERLIRLLAADDPESLAVASRAMAFLKLPGGAERLAGLLGHESADVRAGAAYALAVVPDRTRVADRAKAALVSLLSDQKYEVRSAATFLANDLVEGFHGYSPHVSAAERAEAIERIKAKLGL